jgi:hypothetical protein
MQAVSAAATMSPPEDQASDHGAPVHNGAASADNNIRPRAASRAARPAPGRPMRAGNWPASRVSQPPQPISAAAWLKKVADGGRL